MLLKSKSFRGPQSTGASLQGTLPIKGWCTLLSNLASTALIVLGTMRHKADRKCYFLIQGQQANIKRQEIFLW